MLVQRKTVTNMKRLLLNHDRRGEVASCVGFKRSNSQLKCQMPVSKVTEVQYLLLSVEADSASLTQWAKLNMLTKNSHESCFIYAVQKHSFTPKVLTVWGVQGSLDLDKLAEKFFLLPGRITILLYFKYRDSKYKDTGYEELEESSL